jgi:AcrR family transcriptional regulator
MAPPLRTPRTTWVQEGLRALADGGPEAVRIEPLARALGVTRGGFYWHFDDRRALLDEMLDTWERFAVDRVIERVESDGDDEDARSKLRRLFAIGAGAGDVLRTELAIRDWARRDEAVARRLKRLDNRRLDYMRTLFAAFADDDADAEVRCLLAFALFVGHPLIAGDHPGRTRREVRDLALAHLLR